MLQTRCNHWGKATDQKPGFDKAARYHCDHLGTPLEMTDEQGKIVWSARYEAFGKASVKMKEKYRNPIRFQGQYEDEETGLHYNYHRYYDPKLGRYLSKDPIGLMGGVNLRGYVGGWVNFAVDPKGLSAFVGALPLAGGLAVSDGPLPLRDVIAVGILAVAGVVDLISMVSSQSESETIDCQKKPCPPIPPRTDFVPPRTPHWPCLGTHTHVYINESGQNPNTCQCFCTKKEVDVICH